MGPLPPPGKPPTIDGTTSPKAPRKSATQASLVQAKLTSRYHEDPDADHFVDIVDDPRFIFAVATITILNAIAVALEADFGCWKGWWGAQCEDPNEYFNFYGISVLFTVLFIGDIAVRFYAYGGLLYLRGTTSSCLHPLHVLDLLLVLLQVLDVFLFTPMGITSGLKILSAFRIAHAFDWVRRVRMRTQFRDLWMICHSMRKCMITVMWVAIVLAIIAWPFAILLTVIVADAGPNTFNFQNSEWSANDYWGTVPKSMLSLMQLVARDKGPSSLMRPLVAGGRAWVLLPLLAFGCIASLGLVNTIIGAIVESCMSEAKENAERAERQKVKLHNQVLESLQGILTEADYDKSGDLDIEELRRAMKTRRFQDRLHMLQLPHNDLELLFALLDGDETGSVKIDAFFRGCARLLGPAMAIDLHQMSVDLTRNIAWANKYLEKTSDTNDMLAALLDTVEKVDIDIVQGDHDHLDPVLTARRGRVRESRATNIRGTALDDLMAPSKDSNLHPRHSSKRGSSKQHHSSMLHHALQAGAFAWHDDDGPKKDDHRTPPHLRHSRRPSKTVADITNEIPHRIPSKTSVQSSKSSNNLKIPKFRSD